MDSANSPIPINYIAVANTMTTVADLNTIQEVLASAKATGVINDAKTHMSCDLDPRVLPIASGSYVRRMPDPVNTSYGLKLGYAHVMGINPALWTNGTTATMYYWFELEIELSDPIYAV